MKLYVERALTSIRSALTPRVMLRILLAAAAVVLLLYVVLPHAIAASNTASGHWESPFSVVSLGVITGLPYGLLAVGLVLIYRSNRIINFAHGQIGAFGAAFFGIEVVKWHIPYVVAIAPALLLAAGIGALAELAVVRRLRKAPAIMSVVATLGVGQFLGLFSLVINGQAGTGSLYPEPGFSPTFFIGALKITHAYSAMLIFSPLVVLAVGAFLKISRYGLGIRGAAANPEAARMAGVPASRMSSLAWGLAGAIACFSAVLTQPTQGFSQPDSFGPRLLLIALTGAVLAKMQSLPRALFAGVAVGVIEQLVLWNTGNGGLTTLVLFALILGALFIQKSVVGRTEEKGSWAAVQATRPLPQAIRKVPTVRMLTPMVSGVVLIVLAVMPLMISNAVAVEVTGIFALTITALSVGIITGLGGQLSLGQIAIGSVGALISFEVSRRTGNFVESFFYGGLASAAVSVLIGLPALRVKGLLLTVTTLGFALTMSDYLMQQGWMFGAGEDPGQPIIFGHALDTGHSYYYVGLVSVVAALWLSRNIRNGGLGRRLVAVRDNEDAARAFTVPAAQVKLQGFALAGFVAGIGGALYGHSLSSLSPDSFQTSLSIDAVKIAVVGGIGLLTGPVLGAVFVEGVQFFKFGSLGLAATSFGQLLVIMYLPGGLGSLITPLRDRVANALARRAGVDVNAVYAAERGFNSNPTGTGAAPALERPKRRRSAASGTLLEVSDLRKSFGGVQAVRGVSFEVRPGEILGLIGPNGAGKTTTFELLAGFTKADTGTVKYGGRDITALSPESRGRMGLIRSFQDAALFPTLTVLECVQLSLERIEPTRLLPALLGLRGAEKRKLAKAEALLAWMGLERYRSSQIQELSTGTRRITEIACLVALQPQLLLLDEPSSGVAQRETEALGALLTKLKAELDLTLVIIEHDIPLIMGLSDRIVCMADGEVIAAGQPDIVRNDPAVVEAYLGGSAEAIERSAGGGRPATAAMPVHPRGEDNDSRDNLSSTVPGLGSSRASALLDAFGSLEGVRAAAFDDLVAVPGIGPAMATRILTSLSGELVSNRST